MKKILPVILFCFFNIIELTAQEREYIINIDGYVGQGRRTCRTHGLQYIKLHFASGKPIFVFGSEAEQSFSNKSFTSKSYTFKGNNPLRRVEFFNIRRGKSGSKGCDNKPSRKSHFVPISFTDCFSQRFDRDVIFPEQNRGIRGFANIVITPKPKIRYTDDTTPISSIKIGCVGDPIGLSATPGHQQSNEVYNWEFFDTVSLKKQPTPAYQGLLEAVRRAEQALRECPPGFNECRGRAQFALDMARDQLNAYTGSKEEIVPMNRWVRLTSLRGNPSIALRLEDMYRNVIDPLNPLSRLSLRDKAIGKPISIRIKTSCNSFFNNETNVLTVQYLSKPPAVIREEVDQLACSYSNSGGFTLFFDRQINSNEEIEISILVEDKEDPTGYRPFDNNTNITSFKQVNATSWSHIWKPSPGINLTAKKYQVRVTGYGRGAISSSAFCDPFISHFTITAPTPVKFTSKTTQPICVDGTGSIKVTASGGKLAGGKYQFALTGGITTGWKSPSPDTGKTYTFSGLDSEKNYTVKVRLNNGSTFCEGTAEDPMDASVTITKPLNTIKIQAASKIEEPSYPEASNGVIDVILKTGTTAKAPFVYEAYLGTILKKSVTTTAITTTLSGLIEGEYTIKVTDDNGCSNTFTTEIKLIDTPAIEIENIKIEKSVSCYNGNDGSLSIKVIGGGNGDYNYVWTKEGDSSFPEKTGNLISDLTPGNYTVIVRDTRTDLNISASYATASTSLTNPKQVIVTGVSVEHIKCKGEDGKITVTAIGGTPPYNYRLGNTGGYTSLTNNSNSWEIIVDSKISKYLYVRDAKLCEFKVVDIVTVNEPDQAITIGNESIIVTQNTVFNDNKGAITIDISGGTPGIPNTTPALNYMVTWERNGEPITDTGTSISGLKEGTYSATVKDKNGCELKSKEIVITHPDALIVETNVTKTIDCYEGQGTISASAIGGYAPNNNAVVYTYTWFVYKNNDPEPKPISGETSSILENVTAGKYKVRVEDGYTAHEDDIILVEPTILELPKPEIENASCYDLNDGAIIVNPKGGTPPYYFSINDKISYISVTDFTIKQLKANTYSVWLRDSKGCEIETAQVVKIEQPAQIEVADIFVQPVTIFEGSNGSINYTVNGGSGNYTYSWTKEGNTTFMATTKEIENLPFGIYTVEINDGNCSIKETFEVIEPKPLTVKIKVAIPILCHSENTGELKAIVSGGYPFDAKPEDYEYQWYRIKDGAETLINIDNVKLTNIAGLEAGVYKVKVKDKAKSMVDFTIELKEPDDLQVTLSKNPINVKCYGEATGAIDIVVTGGPRDPDTGEYLPYAFSWTKEEDPDFKATTEDLEDLKTGTYKVVVIDNNLCTTLLSEPIIIGQPEVALEIYDVELTNVSGFSKNNGSISLEVRGGTKPYRYSWVDLDDLKYSAFNKDIKNLKTGKYQVLVTDENDCTTTITREITEPDQLIVEVIPISKKDGVQCFGEETVIPLSTTIEGGFGVYTYQWYEANDVNDVIFRTPTTDVLKAGTYTVVVTDENGNTDSDTYEVVQPDVLDININKTNLSCRGDANGIINITVTGGVKPYRYQWSTNENSEDISSLKAGKYTIKVIDANQCILQKEIEIIEPTALFVNGDVDRVYPTSNDFKNGKITVPIAGGTPPYTFEWKDIDGRIRNTPFNELIGVGSEKYSLKITDANQCTLFIEDVDLFERPDLEVFMRIESFVSCSGASDGSIRVEASGGIPFNARKQYIYEWFDVDNNKSVGDDQSLLKNITKGEYYVKITDAVGESSVSTIFKVREPELLAVSLNSDFLNCGDGNDWTITPEITGGTTPYLSYLWSNGAKTKRLENVIADTYTLQIIDARGCETSGSITITTPDAITSKETLRIPTCYNGCDGSIVLEIEGGTPPYNYKWNNESTSKDLNNICAGTYSVEITDDKGCQITEEFILDNPEELILDLGEDITLCLDQNIEINATISDPEATYLWTSENGFKSTKPIIEVENMGIYEVFVTDSKGCEATDSIFIDKSPKEISSQFYSATQIFVGKEFVIVDNSDPKPDSVRWIIPEDAIVSYEDNNYVELLFEAPGEYEITLQTFIGLCSATSTKKVIVIDREELEENLDNRQEIDIKAHFEYKVYPNPVKDGKFTIDVELSKVQSISLKVFNIINNRVIDSRKGEANDNYKFDYDMSALPSGTYFILLETASASQVRKLIIE